MKMPYLRKNRLRHILKHCTAFQSIPKHCFYVMMDTDTVCCVYDLYDVYHASKAIPDVNFYVK